MPNEDAKIENFSNVSSGKTNKPDLVSTYFQGNKEK